MQEYQIPGQDDGEFEEIPPILKKAAAKYADNKSELARGQLYGSALACLFIYGGTAGVQKFLDGTTDL